jgi:ComF family protein
MTYIKDFISLVFPEVCLSCGKGLYKNEYRICTQCLYHLPKTGYHLQVDNPVARLFWGRVDIYSAAAQYNFEKGSSVQKLIHHLKYKGQKDIGITLGKWYGGELKESELYKNVDLIIPVPLHKTKERRRGYNQSALFAEGLSEGMGIKHDILSLSRTYASETQTRKSRYNRWKNVETVFHLNNTKALIDKHVLLVDDVVTTGSTLEACSQALAKIPGIKISIATIAYAKH